MSDDLPTVSPGKSDTEDDGADDARAQIEAADPLAETTDRSRVPFSSRLRADVYEKLKAASFWTGRSVTDVAETAVRLYLRQLEEERGDPFDVLEPHEINEDDTGR